LRILSSHFRAAAELDARVVGIEYGLRCGLTA
jgi:hypothetical protein